MGWRDCVLRLRVRRPQGQVQGRECFDQAWRRRRERQGRRQRRRQGQWLLAIREGVVTEPGPTADEADLIAAASASFLAKALAATTLGQRAEFFRIFYHMRNVE